MATRREFLTAVPAVGTAFAIAGDLVLEGGGSVHAQEPAPLPGHFHPKGKAPSPHTIEILKAAQFDAAVRRHTRLRRAEARPHRAR